MPVTKNTKQITTRLKKENIVYTNMVLEQVRTDNGEECQDCKII
jgi:hypothetical protein